MPACLDVLRLAFSSHTRGATVVQTVKNPLAPRPVSARMTRLINRFYAEVFFESQTLYNYSKDIDDVTLATIGTA